jgi:hypothetical protein
MFRYCILARSLLSLFQLIHTSYYPCYPHVLLLHTSYYPYYHCSCYYILATILAIPMFRYCILARSLLSLFQLIHTSYYPCYPHVPLLHTSYYPYYHCSCYYILATILAIPMFRYCILATILTITVLANTYKLLSLQSPVS